MLHRILDNWNSITKYNDKNNAVAKQCPHILGDPRHYSLAELQQCFHLAFLVGSLGLKYQFVTVLSLEFFSAPH
jgi:hypothetical protein